MPFNNVIPRELIEQILKRHYNKKPLKNVDRKNPESKKQKKPKK